MTEILLGVGFFTGVVLLLVFLILLAKSWLVKSGTARIVINDDPEKSIVVPVGGKLLGALAETAIPIYTDLKTEADTAAEDGVVGNVRSAISLYYAQQAAQGNPAFPDALDPAAAGSGASTANPFFINVLADGVVRDWSKDASGNYLGPNGGTYKYTAATGKFDKQ